MTRSAYERVSAAVAFAARSLALAVSVAAPRVVCAAERVVCAAVARERVAVLERRGDFAAVGLRREVVVEFLVVSAMAADQPLSDGLSKLILSPSEGTLPLERLFVNRGMSVLTAGRAIDVVPRRVRRRAHP